jgi:hypothetical protein
MPHSRPSDIRSQTPSTGPRDDENQPRHSSEEAGRTSQLHRPPETEQPSPAALSARMMPTSPRSVGCCQRHTPGPADGRQCATHRRSCNGLGCLRHASDIPGAAASPARLPSSLLEPPRTWRTSGSPLINVHGKPWARPWPNHMVHSRPASESQNQHIAEEAHHAAAHGPTNAERASEHRKTHSGHPAPSGRRKTDPTLRLPARRS